MDGGYTQLRRKAGGQKMTVWIVWFFAIGLIFVLGLASAHVGHGKHANGEKSSTNSPTGKNPSSINIPMNEAKSGSSPHVAALSLQTNIGASGTLSRSHQRASSEI